MIFAEKDPAESSTLVLIKLVNELHIVKNLSEPLFNMFVSRKVDLIIHLQQIAIFSKHFLFFPFQVI